MADLITRIEELTPEWLTAVLRRSDALSAGSVTAVNILQDQGSIVKLDIQYAPDAVGEKPRYLVFKFGGVLEGRFYRDLAPEMSKVIELVHCYEAVYSTEKGQSHLLFTDVSDTHFGPPQMLPMTLPNAVQIAHTLADIHAHWWEHPRLKTDVLTVAANSPARLLWQARDQFAGFVNYLGDRLSLKRRAIYESVLHFLPSKNWEERLESVRQVTLVHGDAHWWNFMYPRDLRKSPIYVMDWEAWHINIGVSDLAYAVAVECFPEHREAIEMPLVRHYHRRLQKQGIKDYDWDQCWLDYRMSVVHHLLLPIIWYQKIPPAIWWPAIECTMQAFEDLHCADLL